MSTQNHFHIHISCLRPDCARAVSIRMPQRSAAAGCRYRAGFRATEYLRAAVTEASWPSVSPVPDAGEEGCGGA
ncbi:CDP-diacylglycerol diphosphatase [Klebsiella pneumoniae]|nr:CDP-diacylglycerol diphosphatase [Klebsiella pneumoniae]